MASTPPDPYVALGISPTASDEELRTAYRRLVQRHHPDHNDGSRESALRFAEVQEAYAHVRLLRKRASAPGADPAGARPGGPTAAAHETAAADPELEARLAAMEQELTAARRQREKAARAAAHEAARASRRRGSAAAGRGEDRPSDEELGYYSTDDSFTQILDDFADQVSARFAEAHPPQAPRPRQDRSGQDGSQRPRSLADWIDELGSRLTGEPRRRSDED